MSEAGANLRCEGLRIDDASGPRVDGLSVDAAGQRIALVGDWDPLLELLQGRARSARGVAELAGIDAASGVRSGQIALALARPQIPTHLSVRQWVEAGAALSGVPRREGSRRSRDALGRVGLDGSARDRAHLLPPYERRLLALAVAWTRPRRALVVEHPFRGLSEAGQQRFLAKLWARPADEVQICTFQRVPVAGPVREWLGRFDHVVLLQGSSVVSAGPPAQVLTQKTGRLLVGVVANLAALVTKLRGAGLAVSWAQEEAVGGSSEHAPGGRLVVELVTSDSRRLFELAAECHAALVELTPVSVGWAPE